MKKVAFLLLALVFSCVMTSAMAEALDPYMGMAAMDPADAMAAMIVPLVVILVILIVMLIVWIKIARNMARIAADKGYTERKWFHYCFWLGLVGFLMICAMPDKKLRRALRSGEH